MKDVLNQYNPWWNGDDPAAGLRLREKYIIQMSKIAEKDGAVHISGLPRVGKTSLLKLFIKKLIYENVDPKQILYVDMKDFALSGYMFEEIIDEYRKALRLSSNIKVRVFLDGAEYADNLSAQVEKAGDLNISLLATATSGPDVFERTVEVGPLDFFEYLDFKEIKFRWDDSRLSQPYFEDYVKSGGIPENVKNPKREFLTQFVDGIIKEKVAAVYGVKNIKLLRDFFSLLMMKSGKKFSLNKTAEMLGVSVDTAKRYFEYFCSAKLIFPVTCYGKKKKRMVSPKKIYAADLGIKYMFCSDKDLAQYLENYIFLQFKVKKKLFFLEEAGIRFNFFSEDKILIHSKYYTEMTAKEEKLYDQYPAKKRIFINSVTDLEFLKETDYEKFKEARKK